MRGKKGGIIKRELKSRIDRGWNNGVTWKQKKREGGISEGKKIRGQKEMVGEWKWGNEIKLIRMSTYKKKEQLN